MHVYQVGTLYTPGRTNWPEGAEYNYRANSHELRLFYGNLKEAEIKAVTRRPAEFGALYQAPVLFFLYKFQSDSDWTDCPYSWHLVKAARPDEATEPPPLEDAQRALLNVVLVEATTGIIAGLRTVSLTSRATCTARLATRLRSRSTVATMIKRWQMSTGPRRRRSLSGGPSA